MKGYRHNIVSDDGMGDESDGSVPEVTMPGRRCARGELRQRVIEDLKPALYSRKKAYLRQNRLHYTALHISRALRLRCSLTHASSMIVVIVAPLCCSLS